MDATPSQALTPCDREPIHQIAAIQPFGALIKLNSDWTIGHRSVNCAALLGLADLPAPGANLADLFTKDAMRALRGSLVRLASGIGVDRMFGIALVDSGALFDCAVHCVGERIVLEFEPHDTSEFVNHVATIGPMIAQLEAIRQVDEMCAKAARLVRMILGYDRVMIYKFHEDESGEVIAEDAREDLEPYLGLRYPRSDNPQQARALLVKNRVRVIADIEAPAAAIEPALASGNRPLDMSMSVLRAHSDMHIQNLRNMGVRATLTISILRQGKLWGLISCHHTEPKLPSFSLRTVAETLGQMLSLVLDRMLIDQSERLRSHGRDLRDQLMVNLAEGASVNRNLAMIAKSLDGLVAHDGLTVHIRGEFNRHGAAPDREEFAAIAPDLEAAEFDKAYAVSSLAAHLPAAHAFNDRAAGALIVPISRDPLGYLILWRKPLTQTVRWAGDPSKAKAVDPQDRLQPRNSFAAWEETVQGHSEAWSEEDLYIADGLRVTMLEVIVQMTEGISRERKRAQELLIRKLNHSVRNILHLIRSLVSQSGHDAIDVEDLATVIGGRIAALASAHDKTTRETWSPAPLHGLFEAEAKACLNGQTDRFTLTGPKVLIAPEAYMVIALVVHELMANCVKHGSLRERSGSVHVTFGECAQGGLSIHWRECGGPEMQPPARRGFGSTIIERSIPFELKGTAHTRFHQTGFEADFTIPGRYVTLAPSTGRPPHNVDKRGASAFPQFSSKASGQDRPERMLVVEDSMIIALDVEDNLKHLGVAKIDVASSVSEALLAIARHPPDLAIIDFNLGVESSEPVMAELAQRGIAFVLATGYAELGKKLDQFGALGIIRKPYGRAEIANLLETFRAKLEAAPGRMHANPVSVSK